MLRQPDFHAAIKSWESRIRANARLTSVVVFRDSSSSAAARACCTSAKTGEARLHYKGGDRWVLESYTAFKVCLDGGCLYLCFLEWGSCYTMLYPSNWAFGVVAVYWCNPTDALPSLLRLISPASQPSSGQLRSEGGGVRIRSGRAPGFQVVGRFYRNNRESL